jgi:hypothetical protein
MITLLESMGVAAACAGLKRFRLFHAVAVFVMLQTECGVMA